MEQEQAERLWNRDAFKAILDGMKVISDEEQLRIDAEIARAEAESERIERAKLAEYALRKWDAPKHWTAENHDTTDWPGLADAFAAAGRQDGAGNVLLLGPTGSGKSHAGVALARIHAAQGRTAIRETEPDLKLAYEARKYDAAAIATLAEKMIYADVFLYDDAGKIELARGLALTDFGAFVFHVFDKRAERRRVNIVTSRYPTEKDLAGAVGADLVRRFLQIENGSRARSATITHTKTKH